MAITIVASVFGSRAGGTTGVTLVYAGGATDDIAITFGGFAGGTATAPGVTSPSGYTSIYSRDAADSDFKVEWKRLGATPDPSVLLAASGDAADAVGYGAYVLRGVDTSANPFDMSPLVTTSITATGVPKAPSVITATNGAIVIAMGGNDVLDATPGVIPNFSANIGGSTNDTDDFSFAGAVSILGTAGTLNPTIWSTWASGAYVTVTTALKPYIVPAEPVTQFEFAGQYSNLPPHVRNKVTI